MTWTIVDVRTYAHLGDVPCHVEYNGPWVRATYAQVMLREDSRGRVIVSVVHTSAEEWIVSVVRHWNGRRFASWDTGIGDQWTREQASEAATVEVLSWLTRA